MASSTTTKKRESSNVLPRGSMSSKATVTDDRDSTIRSATDQRAPTTSTNSPHRGPVKSVIPNQTLISICEDSNKSGRRHSLPSSRRIAAVSQYDRKGASSPANKSGLTKRKTSTAISGSLDNQEGLPTGPTPFERFRLKANAVRWLCMAYLSYKRASSQRALKGSLLESLQRIMSEADAEARRTGNDGSTPRGLVSSACPDITFDLSEFQRFSKRVEEIPKRIKELLRVPQERRTQEQIENIARSMQHIEEFAKYPPEIQRKMCEFAWFDRYGPHQVVIKEGQKSEGFYIVLSGSLTETTAGHTYLLNKGNKFGENDLIRGSKRISTVMTKTEVEMFYLHSEDYTEVFTTKLSIKAEDCISYLGKIPIFQIWGGLDKLLDSPVNWGIQNYRPGQVIVPDSNADNWIYLVKSGTCDVLKHLIPSICTVDYSKKNHKKYKKALGAVEMNRIHESNKPGTRKLVIPQIRTLSHDLLVSSKINGKAFLTTPKHQSAGSSFNHTNRGSDNPPSGKEMNLNLKPGVITEKPGKSREMSRLTSCIKQGSSQDIPHCVRVAELTAGDVFGLLAVLPSYKGTSVSLVSQGAEAIRINKTFFLKYADERVFTQIEMRYQPYPSQDECLQDLDTTSQWQQYKESEVQKTLGWIATAPR